MKTRQHFNLYRGTRRQLKFCSVGILFLISISIFSLSCDKPALVVESTAESDQAFSVSRSGKSESATPNAGTILDRNGSPDSSLIITSERWESLLGDSLIIIETFDLRLIHKLSNDSTLDYGNVKFGDVHLNRLGDQFDKWVSWNYIAQLMNNQRNSVYAAWEEACNLEQPTLIAISQSPDVRDSAQLLFTAVPVKIVNLQTGGMLNTANDLEIVFNRSLQKGAVFLIGSDSAGWYYHFELLRSASKLTIPAMYIQSVKGSSSTVNCRILIKENLIIGVITSEAKSGQKYYRLPVYEVVKHSIAATLY